MASENINQHNDSDDSDSDSDSDNKHATIIGIIVLAVVVVIILVAVFFIVKSQWSMLNEQEEVFASDGQKTWSLKDDDIELAYHS